MFKVGAKQPVHLFLGGKGLGIQQETSIWVGLTKSDVYTMDHEVVSRPCKF